MLRRIVGRAYVRHRSYNPIASTAANAAYMPALCLTAVRTKYINYGVQGRRENKQNINKKKTIPLDEELFAEMPDEMVDLENDG